MLRHWLVKTEPSTYSWDDLLREKTTTWDGVNNPVALKNMASMERGDDVLIYHTGNEKSVVGLARVTKPADPDSKPPVIQIEAVRPVTRPVPLAEIKADAMFAGSPLVRQGRLSVVPLTDDQFARLK